jgi:vitamin B12 transport system permease protein
MTARGLGVFVFALFSAAMLGLAAGAVWMVASLYLRHPLPWLAVPVGAVLAWTIRAGVLPHGRNAALLAALATLLAAVYFNVLIAGVEVAGSMSMGLIDAMRTAGAAMLWELARFSLRPADIAWTILGMLLAAWLAWRSPRRQLDPGA